MDIQKFEKDMGIISALPDDPNDVGGLSAAQLKAKFDEGGEALKQYINEVLIPILNDWAVTGGSGGHVVLDRAGNVLQQRTRLLFMGTVSDDGLHTVVTFTPADIGAAAEAHKHSAGDITSGILGVARGGTGAGNAAEARKNLGIPNITHGTGKPSGGSDGDIYFQIKE